MYILSHFSPIMLEKIWFMNAWKVGGGVTEAEKHDSGFVEAKRGDEHSFPLVFFLDVDVVVSPADIKLGEQHGVLHIVN